MHSASEASAQENATGIGKRFRTLVEIGRGGMAQVFLAESISHDVRKLVVLKVLNKELAAHPDMRAAFRREADLTSRMNHPNVVQVFEVVEQAGQTIIVMEYLDGLPLSRVLRHVRVPLALHLDILSQVLEGLHHFHELRDIDDSPLNAVHRDVSPQNVVLLHDGVAKVLDFGVAKFNVGGADQTRTGLIKGKIHYMPPEQLLGDAAVDRRADIFALGVMMWEALAGRRMWRGLAEPRVLRALASGSIPALRTVAPDAPLELAAIVDQALAPDADLRFRTAREMQNALEQAMRLTVGVRHPRELAAFMHENFGDARRLQKAQLDAVRRDPSVNIALDAYTPSLMPSAPSDATIVVPPSASRGSSIPPDTENAPETVERTPKRGKVIFAICVVLALGAVLASGVDTIRSAKPVPRTPALAGVQFHVLTDPAEAEVLLDGALLGTGSYQGVREVSDREQRLLTRAVGYVAKEEVIRFDRDVIRLIRLAKVASPVATLDGAAGAASEKTRPARAAVPRAAKITADVEVPAPAAQVGPSDALEEEVSMSAAAEGPPTQQVDLLEQSPRAASLPALPNSDVPLRAKQVSPRVGHVRLVVDVSADPYRVRLPPGLARMATTLETAVRICVAPSGGVSSVTVVRSADPALDEELARTIPRWRYAPLLGGKTATPFCYTLNLRFEGRHP